VPHITYAELKVAHPHYCGKDTTRLFSHRYSSIQQHTGISARIPSQISNAIQYRQFIQDYKTNIKACTTHRSPRKLSWRHSSKVIIPTRNHRDLLDVHHRLYTQLRSMQAFLQKSYQLLPSYNLKIFANSDSLA